ncbi:DoxX family protein [Dokdonella koreensis]|uniref:DoxX family protein n=1 Tax=Dokdonella koreensis DS-123 TaxID=1300342 RepID=A0A160DXA6_9GAMM|nr:DoxX family protein [Dokdonella koreensis]ANB18901.1 Hypothetical protein I596_2908 [Dokdonella koreensis DS-123]
MNQADSLGKLVLRVVLGLLVLLHGISKLTGGVGFVAQMVQAAGLPAFFAYGVYIGEVLAPLMLITGFYARIGAAIIAINMLVAIALVHTGELLALNATGGWALELQGMFLFSAIAVMLMGPGRFAINAK